MSSAGKMCIYCQKPIAIDDRVSLCDRCFAPHHDGCWERNGRCSTFRCAGIPRTMEGGDLQAILRVELQRSMDYPVDCTFCANTVYPGEIQGNWKRADKDHIIGPGLLFVSQQKPNTHNDWFGKKFLSKMLGNRSVFLPGATIKSRSCGKCKRLFIWGVSVDETFVQKFNEEKLEHWCPHCSTVLTIGFIEMRKKHQGAGKFTCDGIPDFRNDWIGHNIIDRFFSNSWYLLLPNLPAHFCASCQYTEVAGHPIYRFM